MAPNHRVELHETSIPAVEAMTIMSDRAFPRHAHDQYGIGVVLSGAQHSWSGRGRVESVAGDVITVNPNEMHDGIPIGGRSRHWKMLYFEPAFIARELRDETSRAPEFEQPSQRDPILNSLITEFYASLTKAADPLAREELGLAVLLRLVGRKAAEFEGNGSGMKMVALARERIDADPGAPVCLSELAALSGVSRFTLIRAFKRETGATPHAYLVQQRVRLARRLLVEGRTLADAAQESGFADQSHMTRAFVRQFAVSPGRWAAARA